MFTMTIHDGMSDQEKRGVVEKAIAAAHPDDPVTVDKLLSTLAGLGKTTTVDKIAAALDFASRTTDTADEHEAAFAAAMVGSATRKPSTPDPKPQTRFERFLLARIEELEDQLSADLGC